jgi:hypothetical protein
VPTACIDARLPGCRVCALGVETERAMPASVLLHAVAMC